eukprot:gene4021-20189_t
MSQENSDEDQIKRFIHTRGGNRAAIARLEKEISQLKDKELTAELSVRINSIALSVSQKQQFLTGLDEKILEKIPLEQMDKEIDDSMEWDIRITTLLQHIEELKKPSLHQPSVPSTQTTTETQPSPAIGASAISEVESQNRSFNQFSIFDNEANELENSNSENLEITESLKQFWKQESMGLPELVENTETESTESDEKNEQTPFDIKFNGERYEELDEETQGWIPCRSVGYCSVCKVQQFESSKVELISPSSPNSNKEDEEADFESGNESNADGPPLKKRKKEKKSGRKTSWPDTLLADFIDIIVSNEYFKKKLIFQNVKNKKNCEIYGNILKELKKRVHARNENCNYTVIQLRNKFKKVVGECKKAALVMKTASGIKRFQEEKNYGVWFNQLLELVKTRESCQPEQAIEPSERSFDSTSECVAPAESTPEFFIPVMKAPKRVWAL